VTAAASVPTSFTSTKLFCFTNEMNRLRPIVEDRRVKSVAGGEGRF
jgi:hypothetical protein